MKRCWAGLFCLWLGCNGGGLGAAGAAGRVMCGQNECDLDAGQICCDDYVHGPLCTMSCPVGDWLTCDGPEDCSSGEECCDNIDPSGASTATCIPKGAYCWGHTFCHRDQDCPPGVGCVPINPDLYPGVGTCIGAIGLDQ